LIASPAFIVMKAADESFVYGERIIARGFVLWRLSDAGHRVLGFS
jgi:hypothetical protein